MSTYVAPTVSSARGAKARAVPSLCASGSFKHYRRSTITKAPRKRTFLANMTKYSGNLCAPAGAFSHKVAMLYCGVCCENYQEISYGGDGNNSGNGNNGNNNHDHNGPHDFDSNGGIFRFLQFFGNSLLGALALVTAVAAFPDSSTAAVRGSAPKCCPPAATSSASRPRSKVMHVSCKDSTLVVPLSHTQAAAQLPGWQRRKIVDVPIELSGRELAIVNLRQYRVRESMLVL